MKNNIIHLDAIAAQASRNASRIDSRTISTLLTESDPMNRPESKLGARAQVFVDYERDVVWCPDCDLGAFRESLFRTHGFRLRVQCVCGANVCTGFRDADLPTLKFDDEAIAKMSADEVESAEFYGTLPMQLVERYPGIEIDENTPLWAILPKAFVRRRQAA